MKCPKCGGKTTVVQVRENGRRRRQCLAKECRHSFHTKEVEVEPMACGGDRRSVRFKATLLFDDETRNVEGTF